jgi:2-polyprenyl-3-methyl-5-hydroxy-6-metoxy-1,4-benzoquinol methylase
MKEFWDGRYALADYAYGTEPNLYLKNIIGGLNPGKILFPAEGEGRNAVYAATLGWDVYAFDLSDEGKNKAMKLAEEKGVNIHYEVGSLEQLDYPKESFDAIALIFAHFPPEKKSEFHKTINSWLKPGAFVIFEAFAKDQLKFNSKNPKAGGPKDYDTLFSAEEIRNLFPDFEYLELVETETELKEGLYHVGQSAVVRFYGKKLC